MIHFRAPDPATCEHVWDDGAVTVAPTCTADGEKTYTCTLCGTTKKDPVAATGHSFSDWAVTVPPTETLEGEEARTCTVCGFAEKRKLEKSAPDPVVPADAVPGDVDGVDGITAADARLALRCAVGLEDYAPGSPEYLACDVDGTDGVTAADARLILRAAVGLETLA